MRLWTPNPAAMIAPKFRAGAFFSFPASAITTQAQTSGALNAVPIDIAACVIASIGLEVTTPAASGTMRLGIYYDDNGSPGALLREAGTIDAASATVQTITGLAQPVRTGRYWLACLAEATGCTVRASGTQGPGAGVGYNAASTQAANSPIGYLKSSVATGSLPNPFPSGFNATAAAPRVFIGT